MTEIPGRGIKFNGVNYPIICLCGSKKFKEEFIDWAKWFTKENCIVVMPMIFGHSGDELTTEEKYHLDELHKAKILIADAIFVVNVNNYIGESTRSEIEFAKKCGKTIMYLETSGEELTK